MTPETEKATVFVERVKAEAKAAGITAIVIGVSIHKDGHDYWQIRHYGPCLSTMALTSEARDSLEGIYREHTEYRVPNSWWTRFKAQIA